jgi:hypothetical protein
MGREINFDSIRMLEEQIQEHERTLIRLKRARNSLLNVSTLLPPEILGNIFRWNVIPVGDFGGLSTTSYNFLLVCHHWFRVASGTPRLWGFWGNSVRDWAHRHVRCRTAPLDLVLAWHSGHHLDDTLRDALQDRAVRDTIRRVHLNSSAGLLNSVISSIITKGEETRSISLESFILQSAGESRVDVSNFFSRYHFPKLQRLDLSGFSIPSWDWLRSRITSLTTLSLAVNLSSPLPTLSQMLSILSVNPNLQSLMLFPGSIPHAYDNRPSPIQLRHLKRLHLTSNFRCAFGLLNRLELPNKMDGLKLTLSECSPSDLRQTLGPYLGNHIRRRSPDRLRLWVEPDFCECFIKVGDACEGDSTQEDWFMMVEGTLDATLREEEDKLCLDIIAHIPQEKVGELTTTVPILHSEDLCIRMRNLTYLHLEGVNLSRWFVEPATREPHGFRDLLHGLRSISIIRVGLSGDDWSPLTNFLARRAAVGNRISSLSLRGYPPMGEDVVESIRRAVEVFEDGGSDIESYDSDSYTGGIELPFD